jgi:prevent-host-death family protein
MCDMSLPRVGVRELRQNLSVYLRRVAEGETLEVTDRGHLVAVLAPLPGRRTVLDRLVADGSAYPASEDLAALGPPPPGNARMSISEALRQLRSGER